MADALLSAFVDQLTSAIFKMAENELRLVKGAEDAIDGLKKNLRAIKAVLKDAERRQWESDAVKLWIDELNDVSYDMDDVLDDWGTVILRSEIEKEERMADRNASFARKLKVQLSALCRCFHSGPLGRVRHRRDIASKIESLNARLDSIAARKDSFNFSLTSSARIDEPMIQSNTTTSFVDVSKVFGLDTYKQNLIDRLVSKDDQNGGDLEIVPVVGMGGIGKTTLAKIVYNDDEVKNYFGKRLLVCVSDPFDVVKIANAIIEQLAGQVPSFVGLEPLMLNLIASVKDERFLLVLDDVWTDDYQKWEQLEKPLLSCGSVGSRVIVTTRKVEVSRMMGVKDSLMIHVNELSEMDCWKLFSEIAFFGKTNEEREELEETGREIALRCKGLPLAAKTLGSLLRIKRTKEEWEDALRSEIWRLAKVKENLFYPLLLSYFDLSPTEKRCFSYCAVFPKDQLHQKDDLVFMWMAQGYFSLEKYEDGFIDGQRCFENLATRSFFQDFEYTLAGHIYSCKMHDIVHDFAQFLMWNEHSLLIIDDIEEKFELSTRHLTLGVPLDNKSQICTNIVSISNKKNLHSLLLPGSESIVDKNIIDWCLRFTYLRTFILELAKIEDIPDGIGNLVHLKYLKLIRPNNDDNELKQLPRTLGNLCNLQTLFLRGFRLPQEVAKLINLRHLTCTVCDQDTYIILPKGIGRLRSLNVMNAKLCSSTGKNIKEKFRLEDLGNLNHLREIWLANVGIDEGHVKGAMQAQLNGKANLLYLSLVFDKRNHATETSYETHKSTLEALQPPPSLTYLHIEQYSGGDISPSWILSSSISSSLRNLKILQLVSCPNCETLPPLGKLQSLEVVQIADMERVKKAGPDFLGISDMLGEEDKYKNSICSNSKLMVITSFPKLKRLHFVLLPAWREWVSIQGWNKECTNVRIMPRLERLEIAYCKELEALPDFLVATPLKELLISDSPKLQSVCRIDNGKEWAKIQHVPNIKIH